MWSKRFNSITNLAIVVVWNLFLLFRCTYLRGSADDHRNIENQNDGQSDQLESLELDGEHQFVE
jgi:hypothetical protein